MWSRRKFLQVGSAALVGGLGIGAYTWRIEPHWIQFVRRNLPVKGLPPDLHGAILVQISDLHIGPRVDSAYVIDILEETKSFKPDIIVFTGDFISYEERRGLKELARVLEHWPQSRLGTLAVLGNHDYGRAWAQPEVAAAVEQRARDAGITVLRNEVADVEGLQIAGLDDLWGPNFDPMPALTALEGRRAALVLSHNPDAADRPVWDGYRGWVLSGHTHGGQCKPPFLPPPLLPVVNRTYTAGEFALSGERFMYINRGVGHLIRVRFNVRPEVTVFRLVPA
jgi:predicted MPP superfamily phosphohydrolase